MLLPDHLHSPTSSVSSLSLAIGEHLYSLVSTYRDYCNLDLYSHKPTGYSSAVR